MRFKPPKIIRRLMPDPDLGDRRRRRCSSPSTAHAGRHRVDTLHAGQVRCRYLLRGQERHVPRPLQAHLDAGHSRALQPPTRIRRGWGMSLERYTEDVDFANDLITASCSARLCASRRRRRVSGPALQAGDVGHHLGRLQPRRLSPRTCLKNVTSTSRRAPSWCSTTAKRLSRNMRYALPRMEDPADGPQMQGDRL